MNKVELIDAIAEKTGQTKTATADTLDALVDVVTERVAGGDAVQLVGFGTFKAAHRAAREGRNPRTGETITIAAATLPKFTPGAAFKTKVVEAAGQAQAAQGKQKT